MLPYEMNPLYSYPVLPYELDPLHLSVAAADLIIHKTVSHNVILIDPTTTPPISQNNACTLHLEQRWVSC